MDTNRDSAHQSQKEDNFSTFSLGLEFLNDAEKVKNNRKETRHQRCHDSLHCPRVNCNKFWQKDTLVKPNKWQTGLFQPSKVSLNFFVLKLLNIKLEFSTENLKWNQFLFCWIFHLLSVFLVGFDAQFHRLCYKQLVHAYSCTLSSYGALKKFGDNFW